MYCIRAMPSGMLNEKNEMIWNEYMVYCTVFICTAYAQCQAGMLNEKKMKLK